MADLIDMEKLLDQFLDRYAVWNPKQNAIMDEVCMMLIKSPTVDAVQVVRCKDCKYYNQFLILRECTKDYSLCNVSPDDYCSRGERKDNG